ncbi:MAG: ABC transporter permease, partial [Desulforhopalus sp.]
ALVTRTYGREFLPALNNLVSIGQTFPPLAVLALAVPAVGFGAKPTIIALFLYGLLPIVRNTISGLQAVDPAIREAATGMGMSELQALWKVEMPLSFHVIMAGIKTSVIINIGTATIGATIGAGGLGAPIITGLASDNPAFILQGSIIAALFAIIVDALLEMIERIFVPLHHTNN